MLHDLARKRVLLLQGPSGPFFHRIAQRLKDLGCSVHKVNFNGGDDLYYEGDEVLRFTGAPEFWPQACERWLKELHTEVVIAFGDCRPIHRVAIERARALGIAVYIFEEGYLRPDHVTFEAEGANGHSRMPRDPAFYRAIEPRPLPDPRAVRHGFLRATLHAIAYALASWLFAWRYPHYQHHRDIHPLRQGLLWTRSGLLRLWHGLRDFTLDRRLRHGNAGPYFLVPLQVHLDAQLHHCQFVDIEHFIEQVVESFARSAPAETGLILKHHPLDRPYRDYTRLIEKLREKHNLGARLVYADVLHLPSALRHARGTVVINSTVGLSSIHHHTPVKCLGTAIYDIPGLTHAGSLDDFWSAPEAVDADLYKRFRHWLLCNNQINGSVWSDVFLDSGVTAPANERASRAKF